MAMAHMQRAGHLPIALLGGGTGLHRRPLRQERHAPDDDHRGDRRPQRRLLPEADGPPYRLLRGQGHNRQQRRLAARPQLTSISCGIVGTQYLRQPHAHRRVLQAAHGARPHLLRDGLHAASGLRLSSSSTASYGCVLQMGGDDQWSNMLGGVELIRRKEAKARLLPHLHPAHDQRGQEDGQDREGRPVARPQQDSAVYDFYQYWRNVDDADVEKCLRLLTFLPMDEIRSLCAEGGAALNNAKKVSAYTLTAQVHGEEEAGKAESGCGSAFRRRRRPFQYPHHRAYPRGHRGHRPEGNRPAGNGQAFQEQVRCPPPDRSRLGAGRRRKGHRRLRHRKRGVSPRA